MEYLERRLLAAAAALELARHGAPLHISQLRHLARRRHGVRFVGESDHQLELEIARNREHLLERVEQGVYRCRERQQELAERILRLERTIDTEATEDRTVHLNSVQQWRRNLVDRDPTYWRPEDPDRQEEWAREALGDRPWRDLD